MSNNGPENPAKSGSERARDEEREDDTPRYHGGDWDKAEHEPPPGSEVVKDTSAAPQGESGGEREGKTPKDN